MRSLKLLFIEPEEVVPIFNETEDGEVVSFNGPGVGVIPGYHPETAGWLFNLKASVFNGADSDKFLL